MPVPKRKRSRCRRDSRFANKGVKVKAINACKQCNAALVPHVVCKSCGFYKGVKVLTTKFDRTQKRIETMQTKNARKQKVEGQSTAVAASQE
jgi:large subunit ribosomal protein L32